MTFITTSAFCDRTKKARQDREPAERPGRLRITVRRQTLVMGALLAISSASCGRAPRQEPPSLLPDPRVARQAVESALNEWRTTPETDPTAATGRSVMFVDRQRQPGQKLREFAVLGESEVDNCRRFVIKLSLAEPDDSILAAYYVFGDHPTWVYRVEDFDMMMNMDMTPGDLPTVAGAPRTGGVLKTKSEKRDREQAGAHTAAKSAD